MEGINIAKTIVNKRKEKGITQDDLANFMGVSKSSVSKWETGQSYPDIVFLPQLAAYFNVSLDELMGYEPQMTDEAINKLYDELSNEFAAKPFDEVIDCCRDIVKKYYSCFPLLYRMGLLYVNYGHDLKDNGQKISALTEAKELFIRVKQHSDDIQLKQIALHVEATCEQMLGNPDEIIRLLKDLPQVPRHAVVLTQAYILSGKMEEAKAELQECILQSVVDLFEAIPPYLGICVDNKPHFEETYKRVTSLIDSFNLRKIIPLLIMPFYLAGAQGYLKIENKSACLDVLEIYTDLVTGEIYPLKTIYEDDFFSLINCAVEKSPFGITKLPRDEKSIRQSMADAVTEDPTFSVLTGEPRFEKLAKRLKSFVGVTVQQSIIKKEITSKKNPIKIYG